MAEDVGKKFERVWWKEAVIYQVYPASFKDSNSDGLGDINGITEKLDYLRDLGVTILWLSPILKSPQKDMGYDISDYCKIDEQFGSMEDVDRLIAEVKKRKMGLVMDLVVNHTSTEHPWYKDSASSKDSKRRNWYIWRKPRYDEEGNRQPPNNWANLLNDQASAWTYHHETDEYYLSLFTKYQADLNWDNPEVRHEVHEIARFWLERGIAGFRMDVINLISKDPDLPDAEVKHPHKRYQPGDKHFANGTRLSEYLQEMKRVVLSKYDILTVGEMPFLDDEKQRLEIVKAEEGCLNMIFTFETMGLDTVDGRFSYKQWCIEDLRRIMSDSQFLCTKDGWSSQFTENHDQPRSISRWLDDSDAHRLASSKLMCMTQISLTGTLYIYQGQELGMRNVPKSWGPEEYLDVESKDYWNHVCSEHPEGSPEREKALDLMQRKARDNARTPIQWDSTANAGFCPAGVKPWMRVNDDYKVINAAAQTAAGRANERSAIVPAYRFWQRALELRKKHANVFVYGQFKLIDHGHPSVWAFKKSCTIEPDVSITIANCSAKPAEFTIPTEFEVHEWVMGSYDAMSTAKPKGGTISLLPWEGLVGCARYHPGHGH